MVRPSYRTLMDRAIVPLVAHVVGPPLVHFCSRDTLERLGYSLVACAEPTPADAIVVLGGGARVRLDHGFELYRRGLASRIVITSSLSSRLLATHGTRNSYEELRRLGAPADAITWLRWPRNTFEEALAVRKLAEAQGYGCLLVVTEAFHSRRVAETFARAFEPGRAQLVITCPPASVARLHRWWERRRDVEAVLNEWMSLAYYRLRYRVRLARP